MTNEQSGSLTAAWPAEEIAQGQLLLAADGCTDGAAELFTRTTRGLRPIVLNGKPIGMEDTGERIHTMRCGICSREVEVRRYQVTA